MSRDQLRRTMTGPVTEEKRREISDRVSEPVKQAIDKAIKQNKPALRELADH
jgi:Ni,Fe-hydrogenase maturation factor